MFRFTVHTFTIVPEHITRKSPIFSFRPLENTASLEDQPQPLTYQPLLGAGRMTFGFFFSILHGWNLVVVGKLLLVTHLLPLAVG